jgi:hypothetical protein
VLPRWTPCTEGEERETRRLDAVTLSSLCSFAYSSFTLSRFPGKGDSLLPRLELSRKSSQGNVGGGQADDYERTTDPTRHAHGEPERATYRAGVARRRIGTPPERSVPARLACGGAPGAGTHATGGRRARCHRYLQRRGRRRGSAPADAGRVGDGQVPDAALPPEAAACSGQLARDARYQGGHTGPGARARPADRTSAGADRLPVAPEHRGRATRLEPVLAGAGQESGAGSGAVLGAVGTTGGRAGHPDARCWTTPCSSC